MFQVVRLCLIASSDVIMGLGVLSISLRGKEVGVQSGFSCAFPFPGIICGGGVDSIIIRPRSC